MSDSNNTNNTDNINNTITTNTHIDKNNEAEKNTFNKKIVRREGKIKSCIIANKIINEIFIEVDVKKVVEDFTFDNKKNTHSKMELDSSGNYYQKVACTDKFCTPVITRKELNKNNTGFSSFNIFENEGGQATPKITDTESKVKTANENLDNNNTNVIIEVEYTDIIPANTDNIELIEEEPEEDIFAFDSMINKADIDSNLNFNNNSNNNILTNDHTKDAGVEPIIDESLNVKHKTLALMKKSTVVKRKISIKFSAKKVVMVYPKDQTENFNDDSSSIPNTSSTTHNSSSFKEEESTGINGFNTEEN